MPIILDLVFLFILIFYTVKGCKNGLIRSVINLISFFACFFIASWLSSYLSNLTYENLVNIPLQNYISENFSELSSQIDINQFFNDLSNEGSNFLNGFFGNIQQKLSNYFKPDNVYQVQDIVNVFSNKIVYPAFSGIIQLIYFLIIFIVIRVVLKLFSKLFKNFNYIPILGNINIILGGVFGLLTGFLVIAMICFIINIISKMMGYSLEIIDGTYLLKYFYNFINLR